MNKTFSAATAASERTIAAAAHCNCYYFSSRKSRSCRFLFWKQNYYLQNTLLFKYFIRKQTFSSFLLTKFYKKKVLQSNSYDLKFKFRIFRPLLKIDRSTIFLFTNELYLPIFFDQSNNDLNITRNFIRKKIMPLLKTINPKTEQNFYKFSQIANFYYEKVNYIPCSQKLLEPFKP